jgi:hypothetical protein
MTQYDFGTIDPYNKTGQALASNLNSWRNAIHTCHSGATAPTYAQAGMRWLYNGATPWEWRVYDGVDSIELLKVDSSLDIAIMDGSTNILPSTTYPGASPPVGDLWYNQTTAHLTLRGASGETFFNLRDWETLYKSTTASASILNYANLSPFRCLRLNFMLKTTNEAQIYIKTSTDNGASFNGGASDYDTNWEQQSNLDFTANHNFWTADRIILGNSSVDTPGPVWSVGQVEFFEFNQARYMHLQHVGMQWNDGMFEAKHYRTSSRRLAAVARNAFTLRAQGIAGDVAFSGWWHLEGIRNP